MARRPGGDCPATAPCSRQRSQVSTRKTRHRVSEKGPESERDTQPGAYLGGNVLNGNDSGIGMICILYISSSFLLRTFWLLSNPGRAVWGFLLLSSFGFFYIQLFPEARQTSCLRETRCTSQKDPWRILSRLILCINLPGHGAQITHSLGMRP